MTTPKPAQLRALADNEPALAAAMRRLPKFPGFPTPEQARLSQFEYLARSITYQQLSTKAAATIWSRVRALGPEFFATRGLPKPADLLELPEATLRGAGLSRNKVAALRSLSQHALDGYLPIRSTSNLDDDAIIDRLVQIHGIGPWSAQMFLLFKLGRLDVWPTGDLGVQEGVRRLLELSKRPTPQRLEALGERWRPLRSVVAWYAWRLADGV